MYLFKKWKQLIALIMVFSFVLPLTSFASLQECPEKLMDIVILDTENETIIAQVPQKYYEEYREKLQDKEFRQEQIEMMRLSENKERALPEGRIMWQKYMYLSSVRAAYRRMDQQGSLDSLIATLGASATLDALMILFNVTSPINLVVATMGWLMEYVRYKPEQWWHDSYTMLMEGEINHVRMTQIENLQPTYPAAWLIIERIV